MARDDTHESMASHENPGHRNDQAKPTTSGSSDHKQVVLITEKLEILWGDRSTKTTVREVAAARLIDFKGLLDMSPSAQVQATFVVAPTANEMNMIARDIRHLYDQLAVVSDAVRRRSIAGSKPPGK